DDNNNNNNNDDDDDDDEKKKKKNTNVTTKTREYMRWNKLRQSYWFYQALKFELDGSLYSLYDIQHYLLKPLQYEMQKLQSRTLQNSSDILSHKNKDAGRNERESVDWVDPRPYAALSSQCVGSVKLFIRQAMSGQKLEKQLNLVNQYLCSGRRKKDVCIKKKLKCIGLNAIFKCHFHDFVHFAIQMASLYPHLIIHMFCFILFCSTFFFFFFFILQLNVDRLCWTRTWLHYLMRAKIHKCLTLGYSIRFVEFDWTLCSTNRIHYSSSVTHKKIAKEPHKKRYYKSDFDANTSTNKQNKKKIDSCCCYYHFHTHKKRPSSQARV
ncbi:hypothetical protein RFI_21191, partial [Reticulomyxa filosa]